MMLHSVTRILVRHRRTQTIDICFMMYRLFNSRYQYHIDASSHEDAYSERRNSSDARSHVLQIDSTSYLKSIDHRISIRSFLQSSHRCMI